MILDLSESGMRPYHIEKFLNEKQILTRKGGRWFSRIVTNIIEKEKNQAAKSPEKIGVASIN